MLKEPQFLQTLQKIAREQTRLPASHNRLTTFFWLHAWQFWLLAAILSATLYEIWQGRC